jgi:sulfoxide reductase heme-binding subunit YedZ
MPFRLSPLKIAVFAACSLPAAWLAWAALAHGFAYNPVLGANPIEAITRTLGDWALRFLLITLAITPLTRITKRAEFMRVRRMVGLFAFAYAVLHVLSYVGLDQFFAFDVIWKDIVKRRYITVGMITIVLLSPLAVTSTAGWIKRLGAKRWKRLHWLVYPAGIGAVLHYFWMVKADTREPLIYAAVLTVLLGWRVAKRTARRARRA